MYFLQLPILEAIVCLVFYVGILVNSCLACSGCFSLFMYISLIMLIVYYTETAVWDASRHSLTIQFEVPTCGTEYGHGTNADVELRLAEELF